MGLGCYFAVEFAVDLCAGKILDIAACFDVRNGDPAHAQVLRQPLLGPAPI